MEPSDTEGGRASTSPTIPAGSLAWVEDNEYGFLTVKVSRVDFSTRHAYVETHPEGASGVAAAQAAAAVVREATAALLATNPFVSHQSVTQCNKQGQDGARSPPIALQDLQSSNHTEQWKEHRLAPESTDLRQKNPAQSCGGYNSPVPQPCEGLENTVLCTLPEKNICESSGNPGTIFLENVQHKASNAAEAAAKKTIANFVPKPPFEVPLTHLWPYNAPPLPPHPMPDDSASCGTLSAAALLQLLQHRYIRDEIYTYAANVLLAVNPYKPLPHLYTAQQILLYRNWREVARTYRRNFSEEQWHNSRERGRLTDSSSAIGSILDSLPGVLPIRRPSLIECPDGVLGSSSDPADRKNVNPWTINSLTSAEHTTQAYGMQAKALAAEQAFKRSTASRNRPPPHPFVVAEDALRRLVGTQTSQTIVVSGQSGAGKTETSKQLMLFLTHVSTSSQEPSGIIPDKALLSNELKLLHF
ncbi:hypothetical protein, conserved [Eimeria tenella]|uniref:Myosin motor domain-containing protein n=1 Tax=Eimeria tenella TaxID=5802 RepID=U6L560_EIMTE|nr:hypothetical protein, conserved [Eimeria tenella]CDJ44348.1 hypothetical protein, conserved [Eimeria tenella]|eukprot:XP_013235097.1 hypothetical protein, conserved [Eimeria tenella]